MNQPTWQETLTDNFKYELWANQLWLEFIETKATPEESEIFAHILMAQRIWADRIAGQSPTQLPTVEPTVQNLKELTETWLHLIQTHYYSQPIEYKRTTGEPQTRSFGHIARHAANHGTYHRGHLRGLCQARNCTDFPETDLIQFADSALTD